MFQRLCSHKSACRRLQTIQSHAHAHKYTTHVYMKAYIVVHVYGEKPYMSKSRWMSGGHPFSEDRSETETAAKQRFCECGSE